MKLRKLLTLVSVIATSLFLGSCEDEKPFEQAKIGVNPTSVSMTAEAGEATIKLKSNRDWKSEIITNSEDKSWIVIDKTYGAAAEDSIEIKISVTPNTAEDRQATIVFKTETVKAEVRVSQVGAKPKEYAKISDIRALYKDANVKIEGEKTIKASVISNNTVLNNATSRKTLVVSDGEAGISIYLTADNKELVLGDELEISVGGLELQRFNNGALQINALPLENITKLGTKVIPAKQITAAELLTGNYESMYVTIPEVQVVKEDLEKTFATSDKHSSINMEAKTGEKFVIFSSRYSTFKDEKVPQGSGSLSGIAAVFGGTTFQISVTSADDYKGLTGERFANEAPVTPGIIGDYAKWNALGAATGFADNFVAVSSGYQKYEQDAWMFYTNDGSDIKTGWKTGVYNEDKYLDIAPYSTSLDKVTAFALFQRINVKDATDKKLNFKLAYYYQDAADASKLEVVASENFTGDFEKATWTVVKDASFAEGADKNKWVSHSIDLTEQFGTKTNVAIAFRYTGKSNTYRLDDVQFGGKAFPDAPEVEYDGAKGDGVYTSNVDFAKITGESFYPEDIVKIGGKDYPALKLGTSKKVGTCTMSVDKTGDITLTFYAIAWSGNAGELNLSVSGGGSIDGKAKLVLQPNTGANNNSPYTITFGDHDFYTVKLKGLTADSKLTIATASGKTRAILVGINAK